MQVLPFTQQIRVCVHLDNTVHIYGCTRGISGDGRCCAHYNYYPHHFLLSSSLLIYLIVFAASGVTGGIL